MKIKLMIAAVIACLVFTGFTKENVSDTIDHNAWKTSGVVVIQNDVLTLAGSNARALLNDGKGYTNFELDMDVRTTTGGKGYIGIHTDATDRKGYRIALNNDREDPVWWRMTGSLVSVRNLTKSFVKENEWFKMNIRVEGRLVRVRINGETVVEYIEPSKPFRLKENAKALLSQGTISLVGTGRGNLQFKNISLEAFSAKGIDIPAQWANAVDERTDEIIRLHQEDFPVLDYHVHLKGGLTKEVAARQSRQTGVNYGLAINCGIGFSITNDTELYNYLDTMRTQPFILAMQAEGREWVTTFSEAARNSFDYVFTDAMTFLDHKGRRTHLWVNKEVIIDDEQAYMDMMLDRICSVLEEPVDMYVNSCFLPDAMSDRYDMFWTEERIDRFVNALAKSGKALEINELYHIPNKAIIQKAKAAGVKFTFGSNNITPEVGTLDYCIRMKKECGLTAQDMYKPHINI